ncbi:MAG: 23S rRNA (guanosine(2251)-2'-O)-methyltransferase RlmB [Alphaproteobacteria bacterium]|nr:23S rRNA (guanosine(2251)-2'-O)-methyltransferase RlmB [Alphaproteobacteria bacterium]
MKHPPKAAHFLFGTHACLAAIENPLRKIKRVLTTKQAQDELGLHATQLVDGKKLESLLPPGAVHQGIAIECEPLRQPSLAEWLQEVPLPPQEESAASLSRVRERGRREGVLILDQVTDPHNVGAILRSAAAFDIGAVIATDRHAPTETGVMAKTASGAMEMVPYIMVGNLVQAIGQIKKSGYWIYGLDGEATKGIHEVRFDAKTALVMGAEGKGLRRLTAEHCDMLVKLPMSDRMESLNVSNAAAIAMYELFKSPH